MFTSLKIENFRSFKRLDLNDFRNINIVTGMNGSGKSAVLEAVFLSCEAGNIAGVITINSIRGELLATYQNERPFRTLFNDFSGEKPAFLSSKWKAHSADTNPGNRDLTIKPIMKTWRFNPSSDGKPSISGIELDFRGGTQKAQTRGEWKEELVGAGGNTGPVRNNQGPQVQVNYIFAPGPPHPNINIRSVLMIPAPRESTNFIYQNLVNATREKNISAIVEFTSIVDRRVTNFVPLFENGTNQIYVDIGLNRLIPLTMMGAGFTNILQIAIGIVQIRSQIVLIDEIEDGLHYTTFPKISDAIIEFSKNSGVQFFISTHSGEFLDAFVGVSKKMAFDDVCCFRLADRAGEKVVTRFDAFDLDSAKSIELDVR